MARGGNPDDAVLAAADMSLLEQPGEMALVKRLAEWPRIMEQAALAHEPHRIAFYLYELASSLHSLQHQGKVDSNLRFVIDGNEPLTLARLALARATQFALQAGLGILGVTPVEEMR